MKGIIQFQISRSDGGYVASGVDIPIVTQADTLDELALRIDEATALHFEGEDSTELGFSPAAPVLVHFELPRAKHA